ncbi:MAG: histidine kinase dimerization/phosphoacceptor domain -containing protein [bacterium]
MKSPSDRFKPRTLQRQLMLILSLLAFLVAGAFSLGLYSRQHQALMEGIDQQLLTAAVIVKELVPEDYHDRITGPQCVTDADYQRLVDRNNRLCQDLGLEYLWSLMVIDNRIVFTTSTSPDKVASNRKHAAFFETHSNPELYRATFASMTTTYQVNDDKWGRIRVVLVPFRDRQGRPYLYGASMRLSEVDRKLRHTVFECLLGGLLFWAFALTASTLLARLVTTPLTRLTETIQRIAKGSPGLLAEERGSYEQRVLAISFNRLNRTLQDKLAEKESLLKEIHHRVKNNLQIISSLLRLQAGKLESSEAKAALNATQDRVHSMALIHEHLYRSENLAAVDMASYLKHLCQQLFRTLAVTPDTLHLRLELAHVNLGIDQAIPCGLLVNELVTNAFKHAFPAGRGGEVLVELQPLEDGQGWRLRVSDDGAGLPAGFDVQNMTSLGMKLISDLTGQLGGRLEIGSGPETVFTVEFQKTYKGEAKGDERI